MDSAFFVFCTSFALHLLAVAILRSQALRNEQLSSELFRLPIAAHHSQQVVRLLSISHCLPWRAIPASVLAAPVSVLATFMIARYSAVFLFLGAIGFFILPFLNV